MFITDSLLYNGEEDIFVVTSAITINIISDGCSIFFFVSSFDSFESPLGSENNISDEGVVICAQAFHSFVNITSEIETWITCHTDNGFVCALGIASALVIDSLDEGTAGDIFIFSGNKTNLQP